MCFGIVKENPGEQLTIFANSAVCLFKATSMLIDKNVRQRVCYFHQQGEYH